MWPQEANSLKTRMLFIVNSFFKPIRVENLKQIRNPRVFFIFLSFLLYFIKRSIGHRVVQVGLCWGVVRAGRVVQEGCARGLHGLWHPSVRAAATSSLLCAGCGLELQYPSKT